MSYQQSFISPFVILPNSNYSTFRKRSSLIIWERCKGVKNAFGAVKIIRIEQGERYDIVYCDIGFGKDEKFLRKFVCKTTNSRKQIYTLTRNQYAIVYGLASKDNRAFYVKAWWAAYIPKVNDRHDIMESDDFEMFKPLNEDDTDKEALDFLDLIEGSKKR